MILDVVIIKIKEKIDMGFKRSIKKCAECEKNEEILDETECVVDAKVQNRIESTVYKESLDDDKEDSNNLQRAVSIFLYHIKVNS